MTPYQGSWEPPEYIPRTHEDITIREGVYGPSVVICFPPIKDRQTGEPPVFYPSKGEYTFQEFAGPLFELGGYGDITMVNPFNGMRLWLSREVLPQDGNTYDWIVRAVELARECHFLVRDASTGETVLDLDDGRETAAIAQDPELLDIQESRES
jgi:hypothetical protein